MKYSLSSLVVAGLAAASPIQKRETVQGFDVSHYQPNVDWSGAYGAGARFAMIKATEGTSYISPSFSSQYTDSYNAGFIRGAYHFARPDGGSGADQANYFLAHGGKWSGDGKTLPGMLDIEYGPDGNTCYGLSQSAMVSWISDFVNTYHSATTRYPIIYSTADWWKTCTGDSGDFSANCPLDQAAYSSSAPSPAANWPFWTFWQNSDSYSFGGDSDIFNGGIDQLKKLATG